MKEAVSQTQADRSNASANPQSATGPNGAKAEPPGYGIDFLDGAVARREAEPGDAPMKAGGTAAPGVEQAVQRMRGAGQPLQDEARARMEQAFGADFSGVRVHADSEADQLSRSLGARAFTTGSDIFFRRGEYRPDSAPGGRLLAHELAHVVQQTPGTVQRKAAEPAAGALSPSNATIQAKLEVGAVDDRHEREADRAAEAYGQWAQGRRPSSAGTMGSEPSPPLGLGLARGSQGAAAAQPLMREADPAMNDPAALASIDPALERAWTLELRIRAGDRMTAAISLYLRAIDKVQAEVQSKLAQPTFFEQLVSLGIGLLAPGLIPKFFIPQLKDGLKGIASAAIGRALNGDDALPVKVYMTAEELINKYIVLDGNQAASAFMAMADTVRKGAKTAVSNSGVPVPVGVLLKQLERDFPIYIDQLNGQIGNASRETVLGVFAAFDPQVVTGDFYVAQIRDLVAKHEEIGRYAADETKAAFGPTHDYHRIVMLEAWGVKKPAIIKYSPIQTVGLGLVGFKRDYWEFVKWVPPEMEATAIAAGKAQALYSPGGSSRPIGLQEAKAGEPFDRGIPIQGHIDDPRSEGERIVEIDAWGRPRLCRVQVQGDGGRFLGWIDASDESFAKVQAARQPNGLVRMNAAKISGVKKPPT